jgi:hypothetical protein
VNPEIEIILKKRREGMRNHPPEVCNPASRILKLRG